jgi:hypothetical protein
MHVGMATIFQNPGRARTDAAVCRDEVAPALRAVEATTPALGRTA